MSAPNIADIVASCEACSSVALSHPGGCECITCRAARGDSDAFLELLLRLRPA